MSVITAVIAAAALGYTIYSGERAASEAEKARRKAEADAAAAAAAAQSEADRFASIWANFEFPEFKMPKAPTPPAPVEPATKLENVGTVKPRRHAQRTFGYRQTILGGLATGTTGRTEKLGA